MRIGIFFGGSSREREISFAGGRTVYDNLDKSLFEAVPIFVDASHRFILLDWSYLYKGSIRDFYPPVKFLPSSAQAFQLYEESLDGEYPLEVLAAELGTVLSHEALKQSIDFAFLVLHGAYGEDGQIQGLLQALGIPYSGSGIRPAALGMDKAFQKRLMDLAGFDLPAMRVVSRRAWLADAQAVLADLSQGDLGWPLVVRPANQGSSIGVSMVERPEDLASAIDSAFFRQKINLSEWRLAGADHQLKLLRQWTDLRYGLGFPIWVETAEQQICFHQPQALWTYLNEASERELYLASEHTEHEVVLEAFIRGSEFSCVVIRDENGQALALPPTGIRKGSEVFDYRAKYLAGLARKETPMNLDLQALKAIQAECVRLFDFLGFNVYARIDGFYADSGHIFLNDPNTTSGMLPSSFFFHQAAEIGLDPSSFLTYIIRCSLWERANQGAFLSWSRDLLGQLDLALSQRAAALKERPKVAVLLGGYSSERHISVESGRNVYEKLASSGAYQPLPVFLHRNELSQDLELWALPINMLLKDNADDILEKIKHGQEHPLMQDLRQAAQTLRQRYLGQAEPLFQPQALSFEQLAQTVQTVFIALHGRPGEDGEVQQRLQTLGLPYNGSEPAAAALTIDKYQTLQTLRQAGFATAEQILVDKQAFLAQTQLCLDQIEAQLNYPLIAKPMDDGCSSAVKRIEHREALQTYLQAMFRPQENLAPEIAQALELKPKEAFPRKEQALLESLIDQGEALHFLEVTGGLLCHLQADGQIRYEIFEPSETLASGSILSLEEKFLAGEGQNITPARFWREGLPKGLSQAQISAEVRATLQRAAEVLGITGYARIDAFVRIYPDARIETLIIEVNSLPGMTPATCIFHQAALNRYKPYDFIEAILAFGRARQALTVST